jgi:putative ABC transport system ATP-binding protein
LTFAAAVQPPGRVAAVEAFALRRSFVQGGESVEVLDIATLSIPPGAIYGLAGPSGCGKTTLLHLCAGLLQPSAGALRVLGTAVSLMPQRERDRFRARHVGYVFQSFNLIPALSAIENVLLPMGFADAVPAVQRRTRAETLLRRVGLGHRLHHRPAALSHGEQQRVGIARALANQPELLLADEPTASLEAARSDAVLDLLIEVATETGAALLLASHDARVLARLEHVLQMPVFNGVAPAPP